jgi:hypothetical protein
MKTLKSLLFIFLTIAALDAQEMQWDPDTYRVYPDLILKPRFEELSVSANSYLSNLYAAQIGATNITVTNLEARNVTIQGTNLATHINSKADSTHTHAIADTTGLQAAIDGKASTSHSHAIADTTGLQTAIDGKAASSHAHAAVDVTIGQFNSARIAAGTASENYIPKIISGVPTWQPDAEGSGGADATAIHDNVANEITAITLKGSPIANDEIVLEDSADSYNKKSATLGSLPISTATQAALDGKAGTSHSHAISDTTGLQAALDAKAADADVFHKATDGEFNALTLKASPTTSDIIPIEDAAASNAKKKITAGTLPISTATQAALDGKANTSHSHVDADIPDTITISQVATASSGDSDTSPASTAFVQDANAATLYGTQAIPSTTNPLAPTWVGKPAAIVYCGATMEIDLPAAASYSGKFIGVFNTGAFTITIDPNGSEIIVREGTAQSAGVSMTLASGAGNFVWLLSDGTRWSTWGKVGTLAAGS